jgi:hypothetical protein
MMISAKWKEKIASEIDSINGALCAAGMHVGRFKQLQGPTWSLFAICVKDQMP